METLPLFLSFLLFISFSVSVRCSHNNNVPAIFIFGDSIFDAGNNHYNKNCSLQADFLPYGSSFFPRPTGRFTNGRTVPDFLSQFIGLPLQKPFLQAQLEIVNGTRLHYPSNGINFASAGSGVLRETNKDFSVTPLQDQLQQFKTLVEQKHIDTEQVEKSLFFLESGSNDIFDFFFPLEHPILAQDAYVQAMLKEIELFVHHLYELGARRIAIFSLGPIGCVPAARALLLPSPASRCHGKMNRMAKNFNLGLEILIKDISINFPGATGVYGAVYEMVRLFWTFPSRYGFVNVSSACCGDGPLRGMLQCGQEGYQLCTNPNDYLFWDYFHPSEHTYKLISKSLWSGRQTRIRPINLRALANMKHTH